MNDLMRIFPNQPSRPKQTCFSLRPKVVACAVAISGLAVTTLPVQAAVTKGSQDISKVVGPWTTDEKRATKNPVTLSFSKNHTFSMGRMYPVSGVFEERKGKLYLLVKSVCSQEGIEQGVRILAPAPEGKFVTVEKLKAPLEFFVSKDGKSLTMPWCPAAPELKDVQFYRAKK